LAPTLPFCSSRMLNTKKCWGESGNDCFTNDFEMY
jgi:hypothetical protein